MASSKPTRVWSHTPTHTGDLLNEMHIFTSTAFNSRRGLSIVTSTSLATEVFETMPSLCDPISFAAKEYKLVFPTAIRRTAGKPNSSGQAAKASKRYEVGDVIATELPLLVTHGEQDLSWMAREQFLTLAVSQLPARSKKLFEAQLKSKLEGLPPLCSTMIERGGVQVEIGGVLHYALYPFTTGVMNQSCGPNVLFRVDPETLVVELRASKAIEENEELTISYIPEQEREVHFLPFEERQKYILEKHLFKCVCARCTLGTAADEQLYELIQLEGKLKSEQVRAFDALREKMVLRHERDESDDESDTEEDKEKAKEKNKEFLEAIQQLIQMYKDEGLHNFLGKPYIMLARAFRSRQKHEEAKEWFKQALRVREWTNGVEPGNDFQVSELRDNSGYYDDCLSETGFGEPESVCSPGTQAENDRDFWTKGRKGPKS